MALTNNQIKHLRGLAHPIKPVVMIGQHGLTETVMKEIHIALDFHELIKVRISGGDRDERKQIIEKIRNATEAELVQSIGNIAVLFLRNQKKPKVVVPSS